MTTDQTAPSAVAEATTETLTHIVHIMTWPYHPIALFGYQLGLFQQAHPGMQFAWREADYAQYSDDVEIDDVTVFTYDRDWCTFLIGFKDKAGYDAYGAWRTARGC